MWELWFRRFSHQRVGDHLAWLLQTQGLRVSVCVAAQEVDHFWVCVTAERWNMAFSDGASSYQEAITSLIESLDEEEITAVWVG